MTDYEWAVVAVQQCIARCKAMAASEWLRLADLLKKSPSQPQS